MPLETALRLPVVSLAAEYLAMGQLLRRNILTYKAPPNQEGYDLLCINPDPTVHSRVVRVQVKSRYASDSNRSFMVKKEKLAGADYVVVVFLNIGYFYRRQPVREGIQPPEFYTLPVSLVRRLHSASAAGWERVLTRGVNLDRYRDDRGFEQIAKKLRVPYPGRSEGGIEER